MASARRSASRCRPQVEASLPDGPSDRTHTRPRLGVARRLALELNIRGAHHCAGPDRSRCICVRRNGPSDPPCEPISDAFASFSEFNSCGDNPSFRIANQDDHFGIEPVSRERRYILARKIILRSWRPDPEVVAGDRISRSLSVFARPQSAHVPDMSGTLAETESAVKSRSWVVADAVRANRSPARFSH
jgi:hypothetical protein